MMNVLRSDSGTGAGSAGRGVRGSDIGISAVIDIEQRSLGAFEHHLFAGADFPVEQQTGVGNERLQTVTVAGVTVVDLIEVESLLFKNRFEINVFLFDVMAKLLSKGVLFEQIDEADADAG